MKRILLLTALLICHLTHGQDKTIQKSFTNIKAVQLSTSSGNINVKKSAGAAIQVTVKHSYDEDAFTPVMEERNGKLIMKEEFSRGSHSGNSSWEIAVPDNTTLSLNTGSGDISLDGFSADVKSNQGSGDIEITRVKGDLDFNTGSGNIELTDTQGDLSFNSGSGDIRANGGTGKYSFNAGSGNITLNQLKGTFSANTGSGDINAKEISLHAPAKFNTGSGDATITLSTNLDYDISLNSGSGDATLNFNGTPIHGEVIMTANERNGRIVAPFKFDKEEIIAEGNSPRIRKTARLGNKDIAIRIGTGSGTASIAK